LKKTFVKALFGPFLVKKDIIEIRHDMEVEAFNNVFGLVFTTPLNNQHKILKPKAPYVFTKDELNTFLSRLGSLKVPIDYGASLTKHVANKKLGPMKTHDYQCNN
jgi:hypothetical protein